MNSILAMLTRHRWFLCCAFVGLLEILLVMSFLSDINLNKEHAPQPNQNIVKFNQETHTNMYDVPISNIMEEEKYSEPNEPQFSPNERKMKWTDYMSGSPKKRYFILSDLLRLQDFECQLFSRVEKEYRYISAKEPSTDELKWINFSPSDIAAPREISKEIEFRYFYRQNREEFVMMSKLDPYSKELDEWKVKMNNLNLVMNSKRLDDDQVNKRQHLPVWLRTWKRRDPLGQVLNGLCQVHDIKKAILYVTIDRGEFLGVLDELIAVKCVKVRLYFHPIRLNMQHNLVDFQSELLEQKNVRMLTHAMWGLYLLYYKLGYDYVITLEDDLKPLPDFYNYHLSLYNRTLIEDHNSIIAISSMVQGADHHCNYIKQSLFYEEIVVRPKTFNEQLVKCSFSHVNSLVQQTYFTIWGSGLPKRIFKRLWTTWQKSTQDKSLFLGTLLSRLRKPHERMLSPCSNRITRLQNEGVNGFSAGLRYWDVSEQPATFYQLVVPKEKRQPSTRQYTIIE